jgi:hypothetical protein
MKAPFGDEYVHIWMHFLEESHGWCHFDFLEEEGLGHWTSSHEDELLKSMFEVVSVEWVLSIDYLDVLTIEILYYSLE